MARETQKERIEKLEQLLNNANATIERQNKQIDSMIDKADDVFENSVTYKQMLKQIETLEMKIKAITDTADHNRKMYNNELKRNSELIENIQKLKNENKIIKKTHNERGAGRKSRFTDSQIKEIQLYRSNGKTIKEIADIFKCSVGLVHKIINI